ncbi:hypothetical protein FHR51_001017 [Xanthomonas arboricola]|nr:hypothetical protein [Xanthomonas cannabis]
MTTELEPRPAMASNGAQSSSIAWPAQTRTSVRVEHADSEQRRCPCGIDHGGSIGCCKPNCAPPQMAAGEAPAWRARMHTSNCGTARAASANDSVATRGIRLRAPIRRCTHRLTGEAGARSGHAPGVVENILHCLVTSRCPRQRSAMQLLFALLPANSLFLMESWRVAETQSSNMRDPLTMQRYKKARSWTGPGGKASVGGSAPGAWLTSACLRTG